MNGFTLFTPEKLKKRKKFEQRDWKVLVKSKDRAEDGVEIQRSIKKRSEREEEEKKRERERIGTEEEKKIKKRLQE